jgi:hypothetical protein
MGGDHEGDPGGMSRRQAAARFDIGRATAVRWAKWGEILDRREQKLCDLHAECSLRLLNGSCIYSVRLLANLVAV